MSAQSPLPIEIIRMATKLPSIPVVKSVIQTVEGVLPREAPRISDAIPY